MTFLLHARLQTCEPVSTLCSAAPVDVFQNLMHLSAVPPPDAMRPCWCGLHAIAFTAAWCPTNRWMGSVLDDWPGCQTIKRLSLPPLASSRSSGDHLSPHTSLRCELSLE